MSESICKCGKKITWGVDKFSGKKIPLDAVAPVYRMWTEEDRNVTLCERYGPGAVSHFSTCKFANEFSGSNKPEVSKQ